jgi:23S rRNA pseudouridine1911/1915/1917 synthase
MGAMSDGEPLSLLDVLGAQFPASSKSSLRKLLESGRVTVNGRPARIARQTLTPADRVVVLPRPRESTPEWPLPVVYVDEDILVIDKPAGLLTSTVPREKRPTAVAILRDYAARALPAARVGLVHRLDREASGLLVFSLSPRAHGALKAQFADRTAGRSYRAIVRGRPRPDRGTIDASLAEYVDGTVHPSTHNRHAQSAITHYELIATTPDRSMLHVRLETGRKHQIRVHLAGIGHPIVGDTLYGGPAADRMMLAAVELTLEHPAGGRRTFSIEPPFTL